MPQTVLDGIVAVLARWRPHSGARPAAVVPMPSVRHALLVRSVAEHLAAVGRLPLVDALRWSGPSVEGDVPSGARVASLVDALGLRPGAETPQGPLLLVDARLRTGWSVTVAAALLREAGATAVLPLVVHQAP